MSDKEIEHLIKQGENNTVEFKRSLTKELKNEICSFVNSSGGKLLVGIGDDGTVHGISVDNKIRSQLQTSIEAIIPRPNVVITEVGYCGKTIMVIDCLTDDRKPYMCSGSIFIRVGSNSQKLTTPDEVMVFFQQANKIFFEKSKCDGFSYPNDFDEKRFTKFLEITNISRQQPQKRILENLNLFTKNNELNNAGVLFFAKNIQNHLKHAAIRCLLFKGTNKHLIFDDKLITGNLTEQYYGALEFLMSKLELRYLINTAGPRIEKYEIPENVIKEAIINAIVHRDYYETGGKIHIEIYDNRVEISNPGGLVPQIEEKEFGKRSVSRNPIIFDFFQRLNLVEQVGSGIPRMQEEMKAENLPAPIFSLRGVFSVTLYRPIEFEKWIGIWAEKISINQTKILKAIHKAPEITYKRLEEETGLSKTAIETNIRKLRELNLIVRIGDNKSGYWEINTKNLL